MDSMYKYYYDEKTKKIDFVQFNDSDSIPETNFILDLYEDESKIYYDYEYVTDYLEHMNKHISDGYWKIRKCKDCGKYFVLPFDEEMWFTEHMLDRPKRCPKCRAKRRR